MSFAPTAYGHPPTRGREDAAAIAGAIKRDPETYRNQYNHDMDVRYQHRGEVLYPLAVSVTLSFVDVAPWQDDRGNPHPVESAAGRSAIPAHDIYLADPARERGLLLCRGWDHETHSWRVEACYSVPREAMLAPRTGMAIQLIRVPLPKDEELDPYGFLLTPDRQAQTAVTKPNDRREERRRAA
jgi:hypothetical protein